MYSDLKYKTVCKDKMTQTLKPSLRRRTRRGGEIQFYSLGVSTVCLTGVLSNPETLRSSRLLSPDESDLAEQEALRATGSVSRTVFRPHTLWSVQYSSMNKLQDGCFSNHYTLNLSYTSSKKTLLFGEQGSLNICPEFCLSGYTYRLNILKKFLCYIFCMNYTWKLGTLVLFVSYLYQWN